MLSLRIKWCVLILLSFVLCSHTFFIDQSFANDAAPVCKESIYASGRTSSIESVATLSAIIAWMVLARREGAEFELWQNAKAKSVKCKKKGILYLCEATATPCDRPKFN